MIKTNLITHFTQAIKKGLKQSCDKEINFRFSQNFRALVGQGSYKAKCVNFVRSESKRCVVIYPPLKSLVVTKLSTAPLHSVGYGMQFLN